MSEHMSLGSCAGNILRGEAMSRELKKEYLGQLLLNAAILIFFGVLFFVGTFFDEEIAKTLFSKDNTAAAVVTSLGTIPYFAAPVLFCGALYERAVHSSRGKPVKAILCGICIAVALFVGFVGAGAIADRNCFGMIFPFLDRNYPVIAVIAAVVEYPLFFVGFHFAKKSEDKMLAQRMIGLIIILLTAFIVMQTLKHTFHRPRFRTAVIGYDGIGFVPWYTPFEGAEEYTALYGINADEFLSFPSGHSILSISAMYILPSLSWLFPKLENKRSLMTMCGFMFGVIIMLTRMILGAHYLSDVSMGAMIGTALAIANTIIQFFISAKQGRSERT